MKSLELSRKLLSMGCRRIVLVLCSVVVTMLQSLESVLVRCSQKQIERIHGEIEDLLIPPEEQFLEE